jgi:hypothetical protein
MKRGLLLLAGLGPLVLFAGCDRKIPDTPESVLQEMTTLLTKTADELIKIQDTATAEAARPKIQGAWEQWQELNRRLDTAKRSPAGRNITTQSLRTAEMQVKVAKKLVVTEWARLSRSQNAYGNPLLDEFKDFVENLIGQPLQGAPEEGIPATVPY